MPLTAVMLSVNCSINTVSSQVDVVADFDADSDFSRLDFDRLSAGRSGGSANGGCKHEEGSSETHCKLFEFV